jgi:hypothetical protein
VPVLPCKRQDNAPPGARFEALFSGRDLWREARRNSRRASIIAGELTHQTARRAERAICAAELRGRLEMWFGDSTWAGAMIQALDVDRAEPWPDGPDCQEDEALPF